MPEQTFLSWSGKIKQPIKYEVLALIEIGTGPIDAAIELTGKRSDTEVLITLQLEQSEWCQWSLEVSKLWLSKKRVALVVDRMAVSMETCTTARAVLYLAMPLRAR